MQTSSVIWSDFAVRVLKLWDGVKLNDEGASEQGQEMPDRVRNARSLSARSLESRRLGGGTEEGSV